MRNIRSFGTRTASLLVLSAVSLLGCQDEAGSSGAAASDSGAAADSHDAAQSSDAATESLDATTMADAIESLDALDAAPDATVDTAAPSDATVDAAPASDAAQVLDADGGVDALDSSDVSVVSEGGDAPDVTVPDVSTLETGVDDASIEASDECASSHASWNLAIGGKVTASAEGRSVDEAVAMAFDDNTGTKWATDADPTPWIAYEFAGTGAHAVTTYTLTSADDDSAADPTSWLLEGSNDGPGVSSPTWTTLDTRTGEAFASRLFTKTYTFSNTLAYHRYRLRVTANGGASHLELAEMQLFGEGTPTFSIDDTVEGTGENQFRFVGDQWGRTVNDRNPPPLKYGQSSTWCNTTDAYASLTFTGSQIKMYNIVDPSHGIAAVSIDDGPETDIDLYGPFGVNVLVFTSPVLCVGQHTLKFRVTGRKHADATDTYISMDRVLIVP